ncbi:hypothetical protein L0Y59_00660, partial [Candidatus Uhrbacteria bacterium]|nr:hypothetical protein [Candidatus Uhrbacteria bacterium]
LYAPSATIVHRGAQSFGQVFAAVKQRMFNASMLAYFRKWHPGWRTTLLRAVSVPNLAVAWFLDVSRRPGWTWLPWLMAILALEISSLASIFTFLPRVVLTVLAGCLMLAVAWRRPSLGLAALLLELAIGSKGALLKIPDGWEVDGGIPLRIVLFGALCSGWIANAVAHWRTRLPELRSSLRSVLRDRLPWIALAALIGWAVVRGAWRGNEALFGDANAWAYLLLLFPVVDIATRDGARLIRQASDAFVAALVWLPVKTLLLLYVWSHGIRSLSQPLYLWVRRTGVGEVTLVTGNLFRVFIQSQVYAIIGLLASTMRIVDGTKDRFRILAIFVAIGSSLSLLISLSRSLWVGLIAGVSSVFLLTLFVPWSKPLFPITTNRMTGVRALTVVVASFVCGLTLIGAVVAFPYPHVDVGSLKTLFSSRSGVSDAAAESRWNLLPVLGDKILEAPLLGSGFGATVTYASKDPRILAQHPDGMYTTYAYEWGWLDHWIKFGILGIPVMLWLLLSIIRRVWIADGERWLRVGLVSSLVALGTLHVF